MINLSKGGRINLSKDSEGNRFDKIFFGANWGMIVERNEYSRHTTKTKVDLDSSVILLGEHGNLIKTVYFGHKDEPGVHHYGDDLTGDANGDDGIDNETVEVTLSKLSSAVHHVFFVLNIYNTDKVQKFDEIPYIGIRIYTSPNNCPKKRISDPVDILAKFDLNKTEFKDKSSVILGEAYRRNGEWKFKAIGDFGNFSGSAGISRMEEYVKNLI
jgi:tellurium resistance protein TerZ